MRAYCLIRPQPYYRRDAFVSGLKAAGHEVIEGEPYNPDSNTLLLIWNRYWHVHEVACKVEEAGGLVLVAENGYLGVGGIVPKWAVHPSGPKPGDYYALARGGHNGAGSWPEGNGDRWSSLSTSLRPLRSSGGHVLICPSRSFGRPDTIQPEGWLENTVAGLRRATDRPIRVRQHPGNDAPRRPLIEDLKDAWAVVIWASSAGVHALIEGIPVITGAPFWICKRAALSGWRDLEVLDMVMWERLRLQAMQRLAHAQWTVAEIAAGIPFVSLLSTAR
jgi:hypothetical protein